MVAGADKVAAQQAPKTEKPPVSAPERAGVSDPKTVINKLLADWATRKADGKVDLETIKESIENSKRTYEENKKRFGLEDELTKTTEERIRDLELIYDMLHLIQNEQGLWEKHIKNPTDEKIMLELLRVAGDVNNKYLDVRGRLKDHEFNVRFGEKDKLTDLEAVRHLGGFDPRVKQCVTDMRSYYGARGGRIKTRPMGE